MSVGNLLGSPRGGSSAATVQVKRWVREAFGLDPAVPLLVSELMCSKPGCPPLETAIALLQPGQSPIEFKLHKAMADVTATDIAGLAARRLPDGAGAPPADRSA